MRPSGRARLASAFCLSSSVAPSAWTETCAFGLESPYFSFQALDFPDCLVEVSGEFGREFVENP